MLSSPNIAFIKYWGNRNNDLRLPATDSLSMTLDHPTAEITIQEADTLEIHSYTMGKERKIEGKHLERFRTHIELTRRYLAELGAPEALPSGLRITIVSNIPPGIGLASSAAVFSGIAKVIRQMIDKRVELDDAQTSIIARIGSGSAARSVMGGYVALATGEGNAIDASRAWQIAPANHWQLYDIIVIPSQTEKSVGSTEGHALAHTSPHFAGRIAAICSHRQRECIDAILGRDIERLQRVAEEDALDMHRVMETSSPPLKYLSEETYRILREVTALRTSEHLPVLYTMDAGPTVHLVCTDEAVEEVRAFANAQKGCTIFEAKVG